MGCPAGRCRYRRDERAIVGVTELKDVIMIGRAHLCLRLMQGCHGRAGLLALSLPLVCGAAEVTELPRIIVSEHAGPQTFGSFTVDEAEMRRARAASSDTTSLLRSVPGVSRNGNGGVSGFPVIHGMADDRLHIQVDGMNTSAACPNHMNPPLSYLDPSQVGAVTVWTGVAPVSVGGDALGGAIAVESSQPAFAAPGQEILFNGKASSFYRGNENGRTGTLAATMAGTHLNMTYSGAIAAADDYHAGGDFKDFTATGRPGHSLDKDEVGSSAYKSQNHLLGLALRQGDQLFEARYGYQHIPFELYPNQRMDMVDNTAHRVNLHHRGRFDWGSVDARLYHETIRHEMDFGDDRQFLYGTPPLLAPGMPMDTRGRNTGAKLTTTMTLSQRDLLRLGGAYQRYKLDDWWRPSPKELPPGVAVGNMAPATFWNINNGRRDRRALFTEWERHFGTQWASLLGGRWERVLMDAGPVHGYNDMMYGADAAAFNAHGRARSDNNKDLSALLRYQMAENRSLLLGYGITSRSPNLYERYAWSTNSMAAVMNNFAGDGNGYVGNPDLKPERAHTLSATYDWHTAGSDWAFRATPHYALVTDYIDAKRLDSPSMPSSDDAFVTLRYANQKARLYGLDLAGRMPLATTAYGALGLEGLLNYTDGKNRSTGDDLYNIMPLNARFTLTQKTAHWDNALELELVQRQNHVSKVRNEIQTPGYGLVNLRLAYTRDKLRVDCGVANLFDKFYWLPTGGAYTGQGMTMSRNGIPWGIAVPGMGRSVYAGMTLTF